MISGLSIMVEHAITIGRKLIEAEERKMVPRGQKPDHYKRCHVGDRTAQRYKKLARLVAANTTNMSDLTGLSIDAAVKKLSKKPSRRQQQAKLPVQIQQSGSADAPKELEKKTKKHHDMIAVWMGMPLSERTRAIDGIGLRPWLEAMPAAWHLIIAKHFAQPEVSAPPLAPLPVLPVPDDVRQLLINGGGQR